METPFVFGRIASERDFTNRRKELRQLMANFNAGINTILISPRRWGKSSLILKAAQEARTKHKKLRFCFIDLYNVRSEEQFYQLLSQELLRVTAGKYEETLDFVRKFLSKLIPKVSFSPDDEHSVSLSFDVKELNRQPDEVLELAEKIAKLKGFRIVVCIDEFQNISEFSNPLAFQKKLRSHWQKHTKVSYCLYGSRRHMMMEVFSSQAMPFYKFGDLIFLEKISRADWIEYIGRRFTDTGKNIAPGQAAEIAALVEDHPYYVQQLAQQCWLRSKKVCRAETVIEAHNSLMMQMSMLFQSITDQLSNTQVNFLGAVLNGETKLSSKKVIRDYDLGSSANVNKIKQTLLLREIIDVQENHVELVDPLYKSWLKNYYFRII